MFTRKAHKCSWQLRFTWPQTGNNPMSFHKWIVKQSAVRPLHAILHSNENEYWYTKHLRWISRGLCQVKESHTSGPIYTTFLKGQVHSRGEQMGVVREKGREWVWLFKCSRRDHGPDGNACVPTEPMSRFQMRACATIYKMSPPGETRGGVQYCVLQLRVSLQSSQNTKCGQEFVNI